MYCGSAEASGIVLPHFPLRRFSFVQSDGDNETSVANETATNTTEESAEKDTHHYGAIAQSVSVLHPSLQIAPAEKIPIRTTANVNDSFALFCGSKNTTLRQVPTMGNALERYSKAVRDRIRERREPIESSTPQSLINLRNLRKHTRRAPEYVFINPDIYGGRCASDSECRSLSPRKYCIDGLCRECSSSSVSSDCPSGLNEFCSADTGYTCSDCESDDDCDPDSGAVCRAVFPDIAPVPMMPRKQCTTCDKVPESAEIFDVTKCAWRCPFGTSRNSDESACIANPTCSAVEYLSPSGNDAQNFFYTPGTDAINPGCTDCAVPFGNVFNDPGFCATLVNSSYAGITGEPVGDLNHNDTMMGVAGLFPCNVFTCKQGWTLNRQQNQCQECLYAACDPGNYLDGCGGNSTGTCTPCNPGLLQVDQNAEWLNFAKVIGNVNISSDPSIACTTICQDGFFRSPSNGSCTSCLALEKSHCRIGQVLENCGPGEDSGDCVDCPLPGDSSFWTGDKCSQELCSERVCPSGTVLTGCGFGNPGKCSPCPGGLPSNAVSWIRGCDFMCPVGSFVEYIGEPGPLSLAEANRTCTSCDAVKNECPDGTVLKGCGLDGVSRGNCKPCNPVGLGIYYKVETECRPHRCDAASLCPPDQVLVECGFGVRGRCQQSHPS